MVDDALVELLKKAYQRYQEQQRRERGEEHRAPVFTPSVKRGLPPDYEGPPFEASPYDEGTGYLERSPGTEGTAWSGTAESSEGEGLESASAMGSPVPGANRGEQPAESPAGLAAAFVREKQSWDCRQQAREGMKWALIFAPPRSLDPFRPPGARRFRP